jgi:predicted HAD superfamily Cof-like phosphohydrolase
MSDDIELPYGPIDLTTSGGPHRLLTEAGIPSEHSCVPEGYAPMSLETRIGLLIDERNSLRDELAETREQQRIANQSMHKVQRDVAEFHREVCGIEDSTTPAIRRSDLRAALIMEEAVETCEASTGRRIEWRYVDDEPSMEPDLIKAIDGICDLLCVTYGTALEYGIDTAPFWDEVHRTNMAKVGGPVREDGKRGKPDGWVSPDIAGILDEQMSQSQSSGKGTFGAHW